MNVSVKIHLPLDKVVELLMDSRYFKEWKKDFINSEHISGTSGRVGSVTKLVHKRVTMLETITSNNLPSEISAEYEHKRGTKTVMFHRGINKFSRINDNNTLYELEFEATKVVGLLPKIMIKLFAGAGKKYAQEQLNNFKKFAEAKLANDQKYN